MITKQPLKFQIISNNFQLKIIVQLKCTHVLELKACKCKPFQVETATEPAGVGETLWLGCRHGLPVLVIFISTL